ncbi:hypothetical protein EVG20_g6241 [Dentipellis fragilis]|uniref:Uncharacterized protein n=1 Tax=Dentipellis fragilis TaxID=205917 RepID=A0A4Y9YNA3_9AGAM|nr:hypothetical protein EVG20_g6241 [Dentipellis fragilis]
MPPVRSRRPQKASRPRARVKSRRDRDSRHLVLDDRKDFPALYLGTSYCSLVDFTRFIHIELAMARARNLKSPPSNRCIPSQHQIPHRFSARPQVSLLSGDRWRYELDPRYWRGEIIDFFIETDCDPSLRDIRENVYHLAVSSEDKHWAAVVSHLLKVLPSELASAWML